MEHKEHFFSKVVQLQMSCNGSADYGFGSGCVVAYKGDYYLWTALHCLSEKNDVRTNLLLDSPTRRGSDVTQTALWPLSNLACFASKSLYFKQRESDSIVDFAFCKIPHVLNLKNAAAMWGIACPDQRLIPIEERDIAMTIRCGERCKMSAFVPCLNGGLVSTELISIESITRSYIKCRIEDPFLRSLKDLKGASGAPLFNSANKMVGIIVSGDTQEGMMEVVPANLLFDLMKMAIENGTSVGKCLQIEDYQRLIQSPLWGRVRELT